ncbi:kinase [Planoprotostelium fungivorum]|uniref:Kinase n=1 Tax=Planoprotostelium fungivorum TaxID=1890364 RepID=A0A2P6N2H0_9EUKA|nr:kinase [Planoprotostelium fungivorum]
MPNFCRHSRDDGPRLYFSSPEPASSQSFKSGTPLGSLYHGNRVKTAHLISPTAREFTLGLSNSGILNAKGFWKRREIRLICQSEVSRFRSQFCGYGTVFRALMGETQVILKTMMKTPSRITEEVARKEYDFGMKLKHPNLVRMRGSFDTATDHCLVMDLVEGCNLYDYLQKNSCGHMAETRVKKMFKGLARGLEHSHRQGIAHLDIKPENIMVGKDDHLTLIDFGLAAETLGLCHQFSGSADYASPEVWRNMPFEPSCADVWSLGIVLHVLLSGCLPFDPDDVPSMRVQPDLYWPEDIDISDDAKELVGWMLELKPAARPTMRQVLNHRWLKRSLSAAFMRRLSGRIESTNKM